jgi:hypothetical protein
MVNTAPFYAPTYLYAIILLLTSSEIPQLSLISALKPIYSHHSIRQLATLSRSIRARDNLLLGLTHGQQ